MIRRQICQPTTLPPPSPFPPNPPLLPPWFVSAHLFLPDLCESSFSSSTVFSLCLCSVEQLDVLLVHFGVYVCELVLKACHYVLSTVFACLTMLLFTSVLVLFLLTIRIDTKGLIKFMVKTHVAVCLFCYFRSRTTHFHIPVSFVSILNLPSLHSPS